jgi:hypothetical protein
MRSLKPGDLVHRVKVNPSGKRVGKPRFLGLLLEEPKLPRWGNYPKSYAVLTPDDGIQTLNDLDHFLIEAIP